MPECRKNFESNDKGAGYSRMFDSSIYPFILLQLIAERNFPISEWKKSIGLSSLLRGPLLTHWLYWFLMIMDDE